MFEIVNNKDNIIENKTTTRIKILILNSHDEILLGYSYGTYQFIGGHLEENESLATCVEREIKEETGIELKISDVQPFLVRKDYTKDYPEEGTNYLSKIYYFAICTDERPNLNNTFYTEEEKAGDFVLRYIKMDSLEEELIKHIQNNLKANIIINEIRQAIDVYKKLG